MRVAVYLRQSSDREGNEYGIDRQREDVLRFVESRGWTVVDTFVDNDVSATNRKPRPAFERMLAAAEAKAFDVIVARHLDRLLRRLIELERILEMFQSTGVSVITSHDSIDTSTDGGRTNARIMASIAQGEIERKSARQRSGVIQAAKQGRWVGGRRAFGYEGDGVTVRPDEAALIVAGYADLLAGEPLTAIAKSWNASGIIPTQNKRDGSPNTWTRSGVRDVLLNPRNAGLRRHRPTGGQGEFRKDPESFVVGAAQWPAIVSEETWRATVRILTAPERKPVGVRGRSLLTGVALCGICGATVHTGGARRQIRTYRCSVSGHLQRKADPVDEYVTDVIVQRLSLPDALEVFAPAVEEGTRDLSAEADTLRRRLDDVAVDYADGTLTRDQFRTVNDRIRSRLAELETAMATAGAADTIAPLVMSDDIAQAWAALTTARQSAVIDALADVTLHSAGRGTRTFRPETIEIDFTKARSGGSSS
ncbi:recombinase family protein [Rhodococcus sp. 114MFTsu3.1]|uniref:recombinase family protein n=1 Tax=Rhodococcus sp. 114MFTsu3.1 TaxID=1172184 RepID=UPI0003A7ECA3|nr:recombinase family protein [Rhodococcus sp. 114MFTsu3.1]